MKKAVIVSTYRDSLNLQLFIFVVEKAASLVIDVASYLLLKGLI